MPYLGAPPADLTLVEVDHRFGERPRRAMPGVTVPGQPADAADDHEERGVDAVNSDISLLSMHSCVSGAVLRVAFDILAPGAPSAHFNYGPKSPVPDAIASDLGLSVERGPAVWLNLPPARVDRYRLAAD